MTINVKGMGAQWLGLASLIALGGCGTAPTEETAHQACGESKNWLSDISLTRFETVEDPWFYNQHAGERSFLLTSEAGKLTMQRISDEPWMILRQTVSSDQFAGATVRFSAQLKGDVATQPAIHGFEHKAGLYFNIGRRRDAIVADHTPNSGDWDWQEVSVSRVIPEGEHEVQVGFVHQGGGTLWAKEPKLVITRCSTL
ncbi:hypothetical protein N9485_00710 [Luminiphilus sp.]|nr:hypothetical protein [Luminiphilus sp.]